MTVFNPRSMDPVKERPCEKKNERMILSLVALLLLSALLASTIHTFGIKTICREQTFPPVSCRRILATPLHCRARTCLLAFLPHSLRMDSWMVGFCLVPCCCCQSSALPTRHLETTSRCPPCGIQPAARLSTPHMWCRRPVSCEEMGKLTWTDSTRFLSLSSIVIVASIHPSSLTTG
jgi:hypothetical protein